jgi:FkbM family methyltransferase
MGAVTPPGNKPGQTSYAQCGEDLIVAYLFQLRGIKIPTCLDIGAYHPHFANNTYRFHLMGSRVVNIDANPAAIAMFSAERKSDTNLNIGVGVRRGEFDFFIMEDEALNTFSSEEKESLIAMGHTLKKIIRIPVQPINEILQTYFADGLDFLSIDAEGVDFDIVRALDFQQHAPKVICIETINYTTDGTGSKRTDLCTFLIQAGYVEYANTNINSIFVLQQWWFKK